MRWTDNPVITFSRGGERVVLNQGDPAGNGPLTLIYGSTGLGLPPVSIASSPRLGGDGAVIRGVRYGSREVFVPVLLEGASQVHLDELRDDLCARLAPDLGPVEVAVTSQATGQTRRISGYLKDGLTGDFGSSYHGDWQTLGLTFECPDPWWLGDEQIVTMQVAPAVKPFIVDGTTRRDPFFPVVLSPSTILGRFTVRVMGDGPVSPVWQVVGPGTDLVISTGGKRIAVSGNFPAGSPVTFDSRTGAIIPDRWADVSLDTDPDLLRLAPGASDVQVTLVGATTESLVRMVYQERWRSAI